LLIELIRQSVNGPGALAVAAGERGVRLPRLPAAAGVVAGGRPGDPPAVATGAAVDALSVPRAFECAGDASRHGLVGARLHTIKRIAEAALRDDPFGCQAG
jgi:hypothetical protein